MKSVGQWTVRESSTRRAGVSVWGAVLGDSPTVSPPNPYNPAANRDP